MLTIRTKFSGATDTRGSRIIARADTGESYAMPLAHDLDFDANHAQARDILADRIRAKACIADAILRELVPLPWVTIDWNGERYHQAKA